MHITNMKSDTPTNIDRQTARSRKTRFIAHLIVILMLFILPEIVMNYAMPQRRGFQSTPWGIYLKSLVFIAVFYINYYYIIERTLNSRVRVWRFIGLNVGRALFARPLLSYLAVFVLSAETCGGRHQAYTPSGENQLHGFLSSDTRLGDGSAYNRIVSGPAAR